MNVLEVQLNGWQRASLAIMTRLMAEVAATKPDAVAWLIHFEADCCDDLQGIGSPENDADDEIIRKAADQMVRACVQAAKHRPPS